jgi:hypothetical protein
LSWRPEILKAKEKIQTLCSDSKTIKKNKKRANQIRLKNGTKAPISFNCSGHHCNFKSKNWYVPANKIKIIDHLKHCYKINKKEIYKISLYSSFI